MIFSPLASVPTAVEAKINTHGQALYKPTNMQLQATLKVSPIIPNSFNGNSKVEKVNYLFK